jgi:hypothetical protein
MADDPIRQRILEAIETRLLAIRQPDGWWTNLGDAVFLGFLPALGESDPVEAVAILPGDDAMRSNLQRKSLALRIDIHVLVRVDSERPWIQAERGRADVMRAIETSDRLLGGLARDQIAYVGTAMRERDEGSLDVGMVVSYLVPYTEAWGNPSSI